MRSALKRENAARLRARASELMPSITVPPLFEGRAHFDKLGWIAKRSAANAKAVAYCRAFSEGKAVRAPLLTGPSGTGKSHLIWAMARRMVQVQRERIEDLMSEKWMARMEAQVDGGDVWTPPSRSEAPAWFGIEIVTGPDLAHSLRQAIQKNGVHSLVERYKQPTPIFIEDLDVAKLGEWLAEEFYRIIDSRYVRLIPTGFTSNLSISELAACIGDRLARRISDMTEPLVLT